MLLGYTWAHWLTFLGAGAALELAPGPSMLYMLAQTARHGARYGLTGMLGVMLGSSIHIVLTVLGLAALISHSPILFALMKWLGAAYLIWLGLQALWRQSDNSAKTNTAADASYMTPSLKKTFYQGVLIDVVNPKVILFFVAFLPQFVVPGIGSIAGQMALHGGLLLIFTVVVNVPLILAGSHLVRWLKGRQGLARWSERGLGAIFIALGAKLVFTQQ